MEVSLNTQMPHPVLHMPTPATLVDRTDTYDLSDDFKMSFTHIIYSRASFCWEWMTACISRSCDLHRRQ